MSQLAFLQQTFLQELFVSSQTILSEINLHARLAKTQQFNFYKESIIARFQKVLRKIYPVCNKLVGDDFFAQMCLEFIIASPSKVKDLNEYGVNFPDFIRTYAPAASLPYLTDTAKLEWAWYRLLSCIANNEFDFSKLADQYAADPNNIIFKLPQRCSLLSSFYPIQQIWETNQEFYSGDGEIILANDKTYYLFVWQGRDSMHMETIDDMEFQILHWINEKCTMEILCSKIAIHYPALSISELINTWITKSWIVDITSPLVGEVDVRSTAGEG